MLESLWLGLLSLVNVEGDVLYTGTLNIPKGEYVISVDHPFNSLSIQNEDGDLPELFIWNNDNYEKWEADHHDSTFSELFFSADDKDQLQIKSDEAFTAKIHAVDLDETKEYQASSSDIEMGNANSAHKFFSRSFRGKVPRYYTRSDWGADESLRVRGFGRAIKDVFGFRTSAPEAKKLPSKFKPKVVARKNDQGQSLSWPIEENQVIKKIVVHHTAEHVDEKRSPFELMRAIYYYHTKTRGWGDIGYNFVIDAHGNIYEGRAGGPTAVGAHTAYHNVGSIGISLMGNFQKENPTAYQQKSLEILIADQALRFGINPITQTHFLHTNSYNISGHRDVAIEGHGTACPGANLHALLPEIRENTASILQILKEKVRTSTRDRIGRKSTAAPKVRGNIERDISPDFEVAQVLKRKILRRGDKAVLEIKVRNNSQTTWNKGSTVRVNGTPEGMTISHFRSVEPIGAGFTGIFRAQATINDTPNGQYEIGLEEAILNARTSEKGIFFPLQVSGERSVIGRTFNTSNNKIVSKGSTKKLGIRSLQANSFNRDVKTKKETSLERYSFEEATTDFGPYTKIKLSYFDENFALVSSKDRMRLYERNKVIADIDPNVPVTIIPDSNKFIVRAEDGGSWLINDPQLRTFTNNGVLKISNYDRKLGATAYNQFRWKLNFYKNSDRKLFIVNELPLEKYLWGLSEQPSTEPMEKKHAIHVLARSYAHVYGGSRRKFKTNLYDLEDSPRTSQFYLGYEWERYHHEQKALVTETHGYLLTVDGTPVIGPYFTQSSGYSVNPWISQYPWARVRELPFDQGLKQKGHGVGLSGNSSRRLAELGYDYHAILDYFFEGVEVQKKY